MVTSPSSWTTRPAIDRFEVLALLKITLFDIFHCIAHFKTLLRMFGPPGKLLLSRNLPSDVRNFFSKLTLSAWLH